MNQIKYRDIAYENALLLLQHGLIHVDMYRSMREGNCGSYERDLEIATVFFNGCPGKGTYAKEMLRNQMAKKLLWTKEHVYIEMYNRFVNISGRPSSYLGVDENGEINNRYIIDDYNQRDSWQSLAWHKDVVSVNIMAFRAIREAVEMATGASTGGSRHSNVDDSLDVQKMAKALIQEQVCKRMQGRYSSGGQTHNAEIKETVDAITNGRDKIWQSAACDRIIDEWKSEVSSSWPDLPALARDDWTAYLEDAVEQFNNGLEGLMPLTT
jgi:hypothetical protein